MPSDWQSTLLGDLGSFRNGVNFNREQEGSGIPILKVKDFTDHIFVPTKGLDELDIAKVFVSDEQLLQAGDTVIMRSNGNTALVGRSLFFHGSATPITFSGFCIRFRPDPSKIDPRFAAYLIRSPYFRQRFSAFGTGTGITNLSQGLLAAIPVELPSIREQEAIAEYLSILDDSLQNAQQCNETLEAMARAIFKSWFVDFDPVRAKAEGREPEGMDATTAALFPSKFQDSELGHIPEGWSSKTLENVSAYLNRGISPKYVEEAGVRVLNQKCVRGGRVDPILGRRHDSAQRSIHGRTLQDGDILVNSTGVGTLGRVGQFNADGQETIVDSHVTVVRANVSEITSNYLAINLLQREYEIEMLGSGTTGQTELSRANLGRLRILVPGNQILKVFDDIVRPLRASETQNERKIKTLAELRDTLLPRLISGKLRVPEAEAMLAEVI